MYKGICYFYSVFSNTPSFLIIIFFKMIQKTDSLFLIFQKLLAPRAPFLKIYFEIGLLDLKIYG